MDMGRGLSAVVADDDRDVRDLLCGLLRRWGFEVHAAVDGHDAWEQVSALRPDVVLLDVAMPHANGLSVLRKIKDPAYGERSPSVLLVTARAVGDEVALGLTMGADDYISKPFHLGELKARIAKALATSQRIHHLDAVRRAVAQPTVESRPGLHVAYAHQPVGDEVAGGDLLAVVESPHGHVTAIIGDVMGHGPRTAARATFARTLLASNARFIDDPAQLLGLTNHRLCELADPDTTEFVTACAIRIHPPTGRWEWASAGHPTPWLVGVGTTPGEVGPPLGVVDDTAYVAHAGVLEPGDRVLLYTDALVAELTDHPEFVQSELPELLEARPDVSLESMLGAILAAVRGRGDQLHDDDASLMLLERTAQPTESNR